MNLERGGGILLVVMDRVSFYEEKGVTRYKSFFIHFSFKLLVFISIQNTKSLWSEILTGDVSTITKWHDQCHSFHRSASCSLLRLFLYVMPKCAWIFWFNENPIFKQPSIIQVRSLSGKNKTQFLT